MKRQRQHDESKNDRRKAYLRKSVRDRQITAALSKAGTIFVGMDNGTSHFTNFYDMDDLADEVKEEIMNRVSQVMLTKAVYDKLTQSGRSHEPVTLEVEVPSEILGPRFSSMSPLE